MTKPNENIKCNWKKEKNQKKKTIFSSIIPVKSKHRDNRFKYRDFFVI